MSNTLQGVASHTIIIFSLIQNGAKYKVSGAVIFVPTTVFGRAVGNLANVLGMAV
jgi:hypothetical protein